MMGGPGEGLSAILTAAVLCAAAESLMPNGPVKRVGRLVCGLVMVSVLLRPLTAFDPAAGRRWLEDYMDGLRLEEQHLEERVSDEMKGIIEGECAAYIADKGVELGLTCRAEVLCRAEDGAWLPHSVRVIGVPEGAERTKLAAVIQNDLSIPAERLVWEDAL